MVTTKAIAEGLWRDIEERPALFFDNTRHPYTSLVAFISGFQCGYATADQQVSAEPILLDSTGFTAFLLERPPASELGPKGWATLIRERADSESSAVALLFAELRRFWDRCSAA